MKKVLGKLIQPTNRRVRILVGLLLCGLLVIQVTHSAATPEIPRTTKLQEIDGQLIETTDSTRLATVRRLAETDHVKLLEMCRAELKKRGHAGYTCTFIKQEKLRDKLGREQHIKVKFMPRPFSVAMAWTKNPPLGDTLVYVDGKYRNERGQSRMVVRPTNKLLRRITGGSAKRLPDGPDAMRNTLRPCTMFGFSKSIESLLKVYRQAVKHGDCTQKLEGFTEIGGRKCIVLARFLPNRRERSYPAKKTLVCIDLEYLLPVRVIGYGWENELICNYEYRNIDFDVTLRAEDFTPAANGIKTK